MNPRCSRNLELSFRRCRRGDSRVRRESSSLASRAGTSSMSSEESLRAAFAAADQSHVFAHWDACSAEERASLLAQLSRIDLASVKSVFSRSMADHASGSSTKGAIEPVRADDDASNPEMAEAWKEAGLRAAANGELAVVLLAGGQGTRLGSSKPKGMYDIGLPSGRTLFRLQCERLARLQRDAARHSTGKEASPITVPLYVMTSPFTHAETEAYFESNGYFGLDAAAVTFFQQGDLPCFSEAGAILMKSRSEVATAPDGNGGVYKALHASGCVADMKRRGVKHVYAYCVDNAAVKVGDPVFVGFCVSKACDAGAKVIQKAYPTEPVGVFTRRDGKVHVVEYSEMPESLATARLEAGETGDPGGGALKFDAANIVLHYYSISFLESCCDPEGPVQRQLAYHVARKKIPVVSDDGKESVTPITPNGVKLEAFIFDVYAYAGDSVAFLNGVRAEDFAPVKNAEGAGKDSPCTARRLLSDLHRSWIENNGGEVVGDGLIEIAPAVSYAGGGLEFAEGRRFAAGESVEEDVWVEARRVPAKSAEKRRETEREEIRGDEDGAKRAKTK